MTKRYLDLLERVCWTFVQAFLGAWIVLGDAALDLDALFSETNLKVGLAGGVLAVAKCLLGFQVGSPRTAATLPAGPDTDQG